MRCDRCTGTGELPSTYRHDHGGKIHYLDTLVTCWDCGGTGQLPGPSSVEHKIGDSIKHTDLFSLYVRYDDGTEPYYTETQARYGMGAIRYWSAQPNVTSLIWIVVAGHTKYQGRIAGPAATEPITNVLPVNLPVQDEGIAA